MKKFFNDPVLLLLIAITIVLMLMSAKTESKENRNDCGRFKVTNNGEFVTYADSVYELKTNGVVYFDGAQAGQSFGNVNVYWVDCSKMNSK